MSPEETLHIEHACARLVADYCHFVDHGEASRIAELFTEDGVWKGPGALHEGRAEIRRAFQAREAMKGRTSRHVCTNLRVDVHDADHAEGTVTLILFRHDGEPGEVAPLDGPAVVGEYRDRFERSKAGWRIAHRQIYVSFVRQPN